MSTKIHLDAQVIIASVQRDYTGKGPEYVRQTSYLRAILQILKESLKPKADKSGEEK
jgi:hypothetical protein